MTTDNFTWTDELVQEFALQCKVNGTKDWIAPQMEKFKASKQKPKEWEILKGKHKVYGVHDWVQEPTEVQRSCPSENCEIHSVRRLRDNEIFTVDEVTGQGRITGFQTEGNELFAECENGLRYVYLSNLTKTAKQPLFTTQDGKIICEGDKYWSVNRNTFYMAGWQANRGDCRTTDSPEYFFSTKEAAEEYILMNKPLLSVNDVLATDLFNPSKLAFEELKQLAKSKLKQ
jgi:hypothetical protein